MNDTLSTFIAFAGFLMIFSMLVQSLQEAVKNILKLKTGVWERFFWQLYNREFPYVSPQAEGQNDQNSSSSTDKKKSEQKTGSSTVQSTLKRICNGPTFGDFEEGLQRTKTIVIRADELLKNIRNELFDIKELDHSKHKHMLKALPMIDNLREITALNLDKLLNIYDGYHNNKISEFYVKLRDFETKYFNQNALQNFDVFKKDCDELLKSMNDIERAVYDYKVQIENKIDSWIAQVNAEYRRNMLKWTVFIGIFLVTLFNADSFSIYKYLSVNSQAKTELIKQAAKNTETTQKTNADKLNTINDALSHNELDKAKATMKEMSQSLKTDFDSFGDSDKAADVKKFADTLDAIPVINDARNKSSLQQKAADLTSFYVALQKATMDYHLMKLASLDLPLGWRKELLIIYEETKCGQYTPLLQKLGGLLLTSLLITFGAPFWNDVMNALIGIKGVTTKKT